MVAKNTQKCTHAAKRKKHTSGKMGSAVPGAATAAAMAAERSLDSSVLALGRTNPQRAWSRYGYVVRSFLRSVGWLVGGGRRAVAAVGRSVGRAKNSASALRGQACKWSAGARSWRRSFPLLAPLLLALRSVCGSRPVVVISSRCEQVRLF